MSLSMMRTTRMKRMSSAEQNSVGVAEDENQWMT